MIWHSTRQAIHDALAWGWLNRSDMGMLEHIQLHCRVQKSNTHNNNARIADVSEVGYILACISQQRPIVQAWLEYTYGITENLTYRSQIACELFYSHFNGKIRQKFNSRHSALCEVSVDDYKFRIIRHRPLPIEVYSKNMKIWPNNFMRDWGTKRDKCLDTIGGYDKEGVGNVSCIVRALRGDSEDTPSEILTMMGKYA